MIWVTIFHSGFILYLCCCRLCRGRLCSLCAESHVHSLSSSKWFLLPTSVAPVFLPLTSAIWFLSCSLFLAGAVLSVQWHYSYQPKGNVWWSIIRTLLPGLLWHNFSHGIGEDSEAGMGADGNRWNRCVSWAEVAPAGECAGTVQPQQPGSRGPKGVPPSSHSLLHRLSASWGNFWWFWELPLLTFFCSC